MAEMQGFWMSKISACDVRKKVIIQRKLRIISICVLLQIIGVLLTYRYRKLKVPGASPWGFVVDSASALEDLILLSAFNKTETAINLVLFFRIYLKNINVLCLSTEFTCVAIWGVMWKVEVICICVLVLNSNCSFLSISFHFHATIKDKWDK